MARTATRSRRTAAKKSPARGSAARKAPAKKTAAKKPAAKTSTAKKAAATKTAAKKTAAKKTAARTAAKTAPARKAASKAQATKRSGTGTGGGLDAALRLRLELESFYADYAYTLDHGSIDDWPDFFVDDCVYRLVSRENWDLGLPICLMFAEKRGGLLDRVTSVKQTTVYHERYLTHSITNLRVLSEKRGTIEVSANYMILETLPNQYTKILNAGRYLDRLVRRGGKLRFKEKNCIYDSVLVPANIIYPV